MTVAPLTLDPLASAAASRDPFPFIMAKGLLPVDAQKALMEDFPEIKKPGFFPIDLLERKGAFATLIKQLEGPEIAALLSDKLDIELRDKPRMITVRKWSAAKDGRIHNDGEAKISTALLYLNPNWDDSDDGGRLRILKSEQSFDDTAAQISPAYGNFLAFKRTDSSWHGHKPFAGERRVIQITWLRSQEDYERKFKRGKMSMLLKRLFPWTSTY